MAARNRPRASIGKEDLADEVQLWHSIVDKIRKCSAINRQYEDVAAQIPLVDDDLHSNNRMYCAPLNFMLVLVLVLVEVLASTDFGQRSRCYTLRTRALL